MAEGLLRSLAGSLVDVASAGTAAYDGVPATPDAVTAMEERGIDIGGHSSRRTTTDLIGGADLILTMGRLHLQRVVVLSPDAFGRTFTLKELVRRTREFGPLRPDEALEAWLARIHTGRRPKDLMGSSPDDDIADPVGQGLVRYRRTADQLTDLLAALATDLGIAPEA